ncbi:MAG: N-acyl homoserine lactonase family protein [Actinomycetota bacterium]
MRIEDIARLGLGTFVRPAAETGSGRPRVEAVYGYLVRAPGTLVLLDTGIGEGGDETDDWYRPRRVPLQQALQGCGVAAEDVRIVVNCHLHFDHCGGNPQFGGVPVVCQRTELETARGVDYTMPQLVDFPGARYVLLDGEAEILPGLHVVPTPGHVDGHQSLVIECDDGTVVLAGQSQNTASEWSADALALAGPSLGHQQPLPAAPAWMARLMEFDPKRVLFAHDAAIWQP